MNTGELAQRIRETYIAKKFYNTVDVSVSVTERYVYVGGEVVRPGRIVWTPDFTVAKAIQSAGGFTLYAKESRVSLVRDTTAVRPRRETCSTQSLTRSPIDARRFNPSTAIAFLSQ